MLLVAVVVVASVLSRVIQLWHQCTISPSWIYIACMSSCLPMHCNGWFNSQRSLNPTIDEDLCRQVSKFLQCILNIFNIDVNRRQNWMSKVSSVLPSAGQSALPVILFSCNAPAALPVIAPPPRPAPAPSASLFSPLWLCPPSLLLLTLLTPCPLCPTPANGSARGPDTPGTTHQWWHRPGPRANGGRGGDNQGEYIQTFLAEVYCTTLCNGHEARSEHHGHSSV